MLMLLRLRPPVECVPRPHGRTHVLVVHHTDVHVAGHVLQVVQQAEPQQPGVTDQQVQRSSMAHGAAGAQADQGGGKCGAVHGPVCVS